MRFGWFQMRGEDEMAVQVLPSVVWRHVASLLDLAGQAALAATCRWDYRMIKSRDRSRVLTILFVVAENWWTLLYLYGDAAFYCCVSRLRSLEKITSECFFADILTDEWVFKAWSIIWFITRQVKQAVVMGALLEELGPVGKYGKATRSFTIRVICEMIPQKPHFLRLSLRKCVKRASHSPAVIMSQC